MQRINFIVFLFLSIPSFAQPVLLPSIGLTAEPGDNDSTCNMPWYLGSFYTSGLQAGDTTFDFTLFNLNGDSLNLGEALSHGRPVLLVAGSYTCPVYRGKVPVINDVVNTYSGLLDVYIIYTLEAHPDSDTSVYFGNINPTTANINEGILYGEPRTYGERKAIVTDMLNNMTTLAPVFLDGPCNNWWSTYGPAPNNAYLIDTNGLVVSKHGWFDRFPDNIYCAIDSLLGTSSGNCTGVGGNGNITFEMTSADTMYGMAGTTISVDGEITNTGTDDILVYARRITNDIPSGWATSMCIDVCYSSATDSVVFLLPGGVAQPVHVYFYSGLASGDTGYVRMGFRNLAHPNNDTAFNAIAVTGSTTGTANLVTDQAGFTFYPNPAAEEILINVTHADNFELEIYNSRGKIITSGRNLKMIDLSSHPSGLYFARIHSGLKIYSQWFIKH